MKNPISESGWPLTLLAWGVGLALLVNASRAAGEPVFHDDFDGALNPAWSILRPNAGYYSVQSTGLVLRCNSGDLWGGYNNALNVFLIGNPAIGDFTATAKLRWLVPPTANWAQFDLLAYDDDDNHVRIDYTYSSGSLGIGRIAETGGAVSQTAGTQVDFGVGWFWLQLRKQGATCSAWYSTNGMAFQPAADPFDYGDGTPAMLGFVAMVDLGGQTATVLIDSFTVEDTAEPSPRFTLDWWTIDGGGGTLTNAQFTLSGTIGQPDAGAMIGGHYTLQGGFWGVIAAVQTPGAPWLSVARSNHEVIVSWPQPAEGWVLEWTDVLPRVSAPWPQVAPPYRTNGASLEFSEPVPAGNRFYRLHRL